MNHSSLFIASLLLVIIRGEAQTSVPQADGSQDLTSNFQPSLAVVIGILCIMFSATFMLILYAKFCYRGATFHAALQNGPGLLQPGASRFSGIDKTVIESLPFFKFSSLGGSRQGLECAVCLSKFEDIEVLRLLPKCRHAFHIDCIDQWLDKHSSCPLCRCKVSAEDLATLAYSHSMRSLMNLSEGRQDSNIELFVQREEIRQGSWRLSIGNSFRKPEKCNKEEQALIQEETEICTQYDKKLLHKFHHEIIVSDVVLKNRWSNVSSSDLIYLNSEMLNHSSSDRFSALDSNDGQLKATRTLEDGQIVKIKEDMEIKRLFESKISTINKSLPSSIPLLPSTSDSKETKPVRDTSRGISPCERRSISEITAFSRFRNARTMIREPSLEGGSNVKEERLRQLWLRIARRTVQWFANRERRSEQTEPPKHTLPV